MMNTIKTFFLLIAFVLFFVPQISYADDLVHSINCGAPSDENHIYAVWELAGKYENRVCLEVEKGKQSLTYWEFYNSELLKDHGPWEDVDAWLNTRCEGGPAARFWKGAPLIEDAVVDIVFPLQERITGSLGGEENCEWRVDLDTEDRLTYIYFNGFQEGLAEWCQKNVTEVTPSSEIPRQCQKFLSKTVSSDGQGNLYPGQRNLCTCSFQIGGTEDQSGKNPADTTAGACTKNTVFNQSTISLDLGKEEGTPVDLGGQMKSLAGPLAGAGCFPIVDSTLLQKVSEQKPTAYTKESCESLSKDNAFFVPIASGHYTVGFFSCSYLTINPEEKKEEVKPEQPNVLEVPYVGGLNKVGDIDPAEFIGKMVYLALSVLGSVALIMFVYGGILYMTAAGNQTREHKAVLTLAWTGIGIVVILSSYLLVQFVFEAFK